MDTNQEMLELMKQMETQNRQQARYAKLQCIFSLVALVCCVVLLIAVVRVVPQVQQLASHVEELAGQAEVVLNNLEVVTNELAAADLGGMVTNVDTLVTGSQQGLEQALEKINGIDIEVLNKAIQDLADVVKPLAKFFNSF